MIHHDHEQNAHTLIPGLLLVAKKQDACSYLKPAEMFL